MREINLEAGKEASWGIQGESGATTLRIYVEPFRRNWPGGIPQAAYKRQDGYIYNIPCTLEGNQVLIDLTATETAIAGDAKLELMWIVGDRNARSVTFTGTIEKSIGIVDVAPPEPMAGYVEHMAEIGADVIRLSEALTADGEAGNVMTKTNDGYEWQAASVNNDAPHDCVSLIDRETGKIVNLYVLNNKLMMGEVAEE